MRVRGSPLKTLKLVRAYSVPVEDARILELINGTLNPPELIDVI